MSWPLDSSLSIAEREAESLEQGLGFLIGSRGGGNGDIHAAHRVHLVEVDLRKNDLFLYAHVVVAAAVERTPGNPTKVAHARQRDVDQPVQEFVHAVAAQRDLATDRPAI